MRAGLVPHLFWLFLRSRRQLVSATGLAAAAAASTLTFVAVNAFALSGEQEAVRDLGRFDDRITVGLPLDVPDPRAALAGYRAAVQRGGGEDVHVQLSSFDVAPDDLPDQHNSGRTKIVIYAEADEPFTDAYADELRLDSGVAPTRPGQVALSQALWRQLGRPDTVTIFSGAVTLKVVGVVTPVFGERSWRIVAAPGTWLSLPAVRISRGFPHVEAQATLYWTGATDPERIAAALAPLAPDNHAPDQLLTGHLDRGDAYRHGERSLTARYPLLHTYPALALGALAALLLLQLNRRRLGDSLDRLVAVGIRPRPVRVAFTGALVLTALGSVLLGAAVGAGLGMAARATLIPALADQPLSPMPGLVGPTLRLVEVAAGVTLVGGWVLLRGTRRASVRRVASWMPWGFLRRVAAVALLLRGTQTVAYPTGAEVSQTAGCFVAGVVLVTPDLVRLVVRLLPMSSSVALTARRLMEGDHARHALAATTLACCLALPTAVATLVATEDRTLRAENLPAVAERQVWIAPGDAGPSLSVRIESILGDTPGFGEPVPVPVLASARFGVGRGSGGYSVIVVNTPDELEALLGPIPQQARDTLDQGGVVDWTGVGAQQWLDIEHAHRRHTRTATLATVPATVEPAYQFSYAGAILASTATRLRLPVERHSTDVYLHVSDDAIRQGIRRVEAAGINTKYVGYHVEPLPTEPTYEWYLATAGVALTGFALLWMVQRGQARHLRGYSQRLLAIGLRPRWSLRVQLLQSAITLGIGLLVAIPAGCIPIVVIAKLTRMHLVLDVPVGFIAIVAGSSLAAALLAVLLGLRSLRPQPVPIDV